MAGTHNNPASSRRTPDSGATRRAFVRAGPASGGGYRTTSFGCGVLAFGLRGYRLGELDLSTDASGAPRRSRSNSRGAPEFRTRLSLGRLFVRTREYDAAHAEFARAEALLAEQDYRRESILLDEFRGEALLDRGQAAEARTLLEGALTRAESLAPDGDVSYEVGGRLAMAYPWLGDPVAPSTTEAVAEDRAERAGDAAERAIARRVSGLTSPWRDEDARGSPTRAR
jgi:hypothetical protein